MVEASTIRIWNPSGGTYFVVVCHCFIVSLEDVGLLDPNNERDLFCVHCLFVSHSATTRHISAEL